MINTYFCYSEDTYDMQLFNTLEDARDAAQRFLENAIHESGIDCGDEYDTRIDGIYYGKVIGMTTDIQKGFTIVSGVANETETA